MTAIPKATPSSNLRAALRYAQAGYPVLTVWPLRGTQCTCHKGAACITPGKHPIHKGWETKATTDEQQVRAMFAQHPSAHVGIQPPEGCVIIDVDPRNGGNTTLKALLGTTKLTTEMPVQTSGGGGLHLVFKGEVHGPLGKGIDIKRHRRGFVVAWPAGHVSGGEYKWRKAPWEAKPAPLPECLSKRAAAKGNEFLDAPGTSFDVEPTTVPLAKVREALAHVSADDYQRWINIGQALRHNYGDAGEEAWLEWSKTSSKFEDGDEQKWATFDRNRDRPLITVRSIMSIARRNGYRPLAVEFNQSLWAMGDISGLLGTEAEPLDWVFEPCIPGAKVTLLSGAGGSSKSFLSLTLACQLAIEQEFGPYKPTKGGKALLMVGEEDKGDTHRRLRAILRSRMYSKEQQALIEERVGVVSVRGMDWRLNFHDEAGDLHESERVDYLIDEVRGLGDVRLIVLDPLVAFNGANENDNMEMARLMFTLDRVAERTRAAVLVLHHVSKGGVVTSLNEASQAMVRGASALVDNARATILLTRMPRNDAPLYNVQPDDAGRYVVARVVKNNYGPHTPDVVMAVEQGGALRLAPEVQRVHNSPAQAERARQERETPIAVMRAMLGAPAAGQGALAEAVGVSRQRVQQVLQALLEEGAVRRVGVGTQAHFEVTPAGRRRCQNDGDLDDIIG